jgi:hypothetical protein
MTRIEHDRLVRVVELLQTGKMRTYNDIMKACGINSHGEVADTIREIGAEKIEGFYRLPDDYEIPETPRPDMEETMYDGVIPWRERCEEGATSLQLHLIVDLQRALARESRAHIEVERLRALFAISLQNQKDMRE